MELLHLVRFDKQLLEYFKKKENEKALLFLQKNPLLLKSIDSQGSTLLHHAVKFKNKSMMRYLIKSKVDLNVQDKQGRTALMLAASISNCFSFTLVNMLLEPNSHVHLRDAKGESALQMICKNKNLEVGNLCVRNLIAHYSSDYDKLAKLFLECVDPLGCLLEAENPMLTRCVLQQGYPVNTPICHGFGNGMTALHDAIFRNDLEHVKILVEFGADVNALCNEKHTPLYCYEGPYEETHKTLEILKILIDRGALTTNMKENWTRMPVERVLCLGGRQEIQLLLHQYNLDLRAKNAENETVFHFLAVNKCKNILNELEGMDFDVNVRDIEGRTPLHNALDNSTSVEFLLKNGADVNAKTSDGLTPLHDAFNSDNCRDVKCVKLLLEYGADVNAFDKYGRTPLNSFDGSHTKSFEIVRLLLERGAYTTTIPDGGIADLMPVDKLLRTGSRKEIQLLLKHNLDLNAKDSDNATPVHVLASNTCENIMDELEGMDFDVSVKTLLEKRTPLHFAVVNSSSVSFLLTKGADVNALDDKKFTPLHLVFRKDDEEYFTPRIFSIQTAEILLEHGADPQAISSIRTTVIREAINENEYTAIKPVLAHLAMLNESGVTIKKRIRNEINNNDRLKKCFNFYTRKLNKMKTVKIWETLTLYDLLMRVEDKLKVNMRNPDLVMRLVRNRQKYIPKSNYYFDFIRRRVGKILKKAQVKGRATVIICKLMKIHYEANHIISDSIIKYLLFADLLALVKL